MNPLDHFAATFLNWYREEKPLHMYGAMYPKDGVVTICENHDYADVALELHDYFYEGDEHNSLAEIATYEKEGYDRIVILYGSEGYHITSFFYNSQGAPYEFSEKEKETVMKAFRDREN